MQNITYSDDSINKNIQSTYTRTGFSMNVLNTFTLIKMRGICNTFFKNVQTISILPGLQVTSTALNHFSINPNFYTMT